MEYNHKDQIVKTGDELINSSENETTNLSILRTYNRWYTEALEFVHTHAEIRIKEFEELHTKNQSILCQQPPDLQSFKSNLTIQIAMIEGSTDHDFHF